MKQIKAKRLRKCAVIAYLCFMLVIAFTIPAYASEDVFTAANRIIRTVYNSIAGISTVLAGLGAESEDPVSLLIRSVIYGFLLLCSKPLFAIGLNIGGTVIDMLGIPSSVTITTPGAHIFTSLVDSSWILVIIIGTIVGFQLIKLFFEIGERYVVVCILTLCAPLGFAMGGSKATKDIATGYIRMYASMIIMMILNVVFLKLVLSALSTTPTEYTVIPWCVLIVALSRTARKVDNIIARIGLNPAITGDPLGRRGGAMMLMMLVARAGMRSAAAKAGAAKTGGGSAGKAPRTPNTGKGVSNQNNNIMNQQQSGGKKDMNSQNNANNQSSQSSLNNANAGVQSSDNSQKARFGSQNTTNNLMGKNNQNTNIGGQSVKSEAGGSGNNQQVNNANNNQLNSNQKPVNNMNQGGNKMAHNQLNNNAPSKVPTQINTNRFGTGGNANTPQNKPANTSSGQNLAASEGRNAKAQRFADSLKSGNNPAGLNLSNVNAPASSSNNANIGHTNNSTTMQKSSQNNSTSATQNQGAPNASANPASNAQPSGTKGKNTLPVAAPAKGAGSPGNQGKKSSSQMPSTTGNGKNTATPNSGQNMAKTNNAGANKINSTPPNKVQPVQTGVNKNAPVTTTQGKNPSSQQTFAFRTQQSPAQNGKNTVVPIADMTPSEVFEPDISTEVNDG